MIYARRFLGQFLQHVRTYVLFTTNLPYLSNISGNHAVHLRISAVGSITLLMTYSINVRPYNDPYIKVAQEAVKAIAELLIPGAFLVDIIRPL